MCEEEAGRMGYWKYSGMGDAYKRKLFFYFKQKTAYDIAACLVGSEMCIGDRPLPAGLRVNPVSLGNTESH